MGHSARKAVVIRSEPTGNVLKGMQVKQPIDRIRLAIRLEFLDTQVDIPSHALQRVKVILVVNDHSRAGPEHILQLFFVNGVL